MFLQFRVPRNLFDSFIAIYLRDSRGTNETLVPALIVLIREYQREQWIVGRTAHWREKIVSLWIIFIRKIDVDTRTRRVRDDARFTSFNPTSYFSLLILSVGMFGYSSPGLVTVS